MAKSLKSEKKLSMKKGSSKVKLSEHHKKIHSKKEKRIGSKRQVLSGKREETKGRLKKHDLIVNARGKVVSKKKHASGKRLYQNNEAFQKNTLAIKEARKSFGRKTPSFKELRAKADELKRDM